MKIFKVADIYCGHCTRWIPLQKVRKIPRLDEPKFFTDNQSTKEFKRIYECPECGGVILRSK